MLRTWHKVCVLLKQNHPDIFAEPLLYSGCIIPAYTLN